MMPAVCRAHQRNDTGIIDNRPTSLLVDEIKTGVLPGRGSKSDPIQAAIGSLLKLARPAGI